MSTASNLRHSGDVYDLALERERMAWNALHVLKRTDEGYADALSEWRTAADSIGIAAEQLVKTSAWGASRGLHAPQQSRKPPAEARR